MIRVVLMLVIIMGLSCPAFSQTDSVKLNLIAEDLELEKYDNKHTFYVDTVVNLGGYSFYGTTPFVSSYSFCTVFKNDSIVANNFFPGDMNRMPYSFKLYSNGDRDYLSTYWYGDGTTSSSVNIYLFEVRFNSINLVYDDVIYYEDKSTNKVSQVNSYTIFSDGNELIIRKFYNDQRDVEFLNNRFELPLKNQKTDQITEIEEFKIL